MAATRTALVTGASSGIGAATALRLAQDGWQVVAAARRLDRLGALAAQSPAIRPCALDVTDPRSVEQLADAVPECDLVVANAGGAFDLTPLADADVETWARTYDVNVLGTVRTVQALLPALVAAGGGHVVLTGSTAGRWAYEGGGGYTAAKHALVALRETLRLETVDSGVRVSEVAPGMVATEEFSLVRFAGDASRASAVYEGVDALTAEDIADIIAWVASRPAHVNIDLVQVTPQQQASSTKVHRRT
ncbi:MAG TPA: SDR family NAD(P)-dependent oxidoreductase [Mycobacteriales bacterium]|jgi:NADP-dependent 3-hydroxy acid dehydrogenase YdfG|nr:SDR family NAD(P)-dependent oxidoreductase [Mycobacteriales bacterium]